MAEPVQLKNKDGVTDVDVQNPLPSDGDSVYAKDINVDVATTIGTFSGSVLSLFNDYQTEITDSSATNPKTFTINFNRPVTTNFIGLGSRTGNFSNVKLIFKDSSGAIRGTVDDSTNNTKYTSNIYYFPPAHLIQVTVEFHTVDAVSINGMLIQKGLSTVSRIQALKPDGTVVDVDATTSGNLKMSIEELESGVSVNSNTQLKTTNFNSVGEEVFSVDAFSRLRVSNPETVFDSKNIFNDSDLADNVENVPLYFDNQEISGTGTGTTYNANEASQSITVSNTTAGTRARQTYMRFNYQPGKSQLVFLTFNMEGAVADIIKREGLFDENNGLFLELDGTTVNFVRRTYVTGSAVDNKVAQASWNIDPLNGTGTSGITLDFTKTQIMIIDYEWLGVGRVRMGFVVNGKVYYAHEFLNTNTLAEVYMSTPNLPIRSEITNNGSGVASSLTQICGTVISEGGKNDLGSVRYASTEGTHVDANTENTAYAVLGIRLKSNYIGASIKLLNIALQLHTASSTCEWFLVGRSTVAGTFTYADEPYSAVQIARGSGSTNTVTGGVKFGGGFIESGTNASGAAGNTSKGIDNAILLGSAIDGTVDEIVLCVRPIGGSTNVDVEGSITWRELT